MCCVCIYSQNQHKDTSLCLPTGPDAPENVSATATYDLDSNGVLSSLVLSWDEVVHLYVSTEDMRTYMCS